MKWQKEEERKLEASFFLAHILLADVPPPDFDNHYIEKLGLADLLQNVNYNSQQATGADLGLYLRFIGYFARVTTQPALCLLPCVPFRGELCEG